MARATKTVRGRCRYTPPPQPPPEPIGGVKGGDAVPPRARREWWLRESINDGDGQADMAYVVVGGLAASAVGSLLFIMVMSVISYSRCTRIVDIGEKERAAIACVFDPLPIGQAAGLIFAAFAALIGAFAGYMAATKRQSRQPAPAPTGLKLTASAEG